MPCSTLTPGPVRISTWEMVTVYGPVTLMTELPQVLAPQLPETFVIRLFLIVTLLAETVISPVTSLPSMTVPAVVTLMLPDGVSVVPAGTPTLPAAGSG